MQSNFIIRPVLGQYSDEQLYGPRKEALEIDVILKSRSKSECALYSDCSSIKQEGSIKKFLSGNDPRILSLFHNLGIEHALPIQRYSWPYMEPNQLQFPMLCISRRFTGKTYAHLLYSVCHCIRQTAAQATEEIIQTSTDGIEETSTIDDLRGRNIGPPPEPIPIIDQDTFDFNSLGLTDKDKLIKVDDKVSSNCNAWTKTSDDEKDNFLDMGSKFLIISSSQQQVKFLQAEVDRMKEASFGNLAPYRVRKDKLPPITRSLNNSHDEAKLAIRCSEAEIIICTPTILLKCITNGFISFSQCDKVIFDDLDQALQLHNTQVRELIKIYITENNECGPDDMSFPQILFFAQKWTQLIRHLCDIFTQKNIVCCSLLEASLFRNMRFDIERYGDISQKKHKLKEIILHEIEILPKGSIIAVLCNQEDDAKNVSEYLEQLGLVVKHLPKDTPEIALNDHKASSKSRDHQMSIYVTCDDATEILFDKLTDVTRIIHFSLPSNLLTFDSRFRIMFNSINDQKIEDELKTYIFLSSRFNSLKMAQEIYDIMSRSAATLNCTKLEMRDIVNDLSTKLCWRWATTGVCRLDKFGKESTMASFCPDRHSLREISNKSSRWIGQAEVKVTITNIISPNEFYFWFEEYRNEQTKWKKYDLSGINFMYKLQPGLDRFKETPRCDVPLESIKKGSIFGVYFHELSRVDRVILLESPIYPRILTDYDRLICYDYQCRAFKIDYGIEVTIYLRNLFSLPKSLTAIEPLCHRGFLLGLKPADNEPYWNYKASKLFHEKIYMDHLQDASLWMRFNDGDCFWFEDFVLSRKLYNIDGSRNKSIPRCNLVKELKANTNLTESCLDPPFIDPSERSRCTSRWHTDLTKTLANHAFLRTDKNELDILVLHVRPDIKLVVRQRDFHEQLIKLENQLIDDYKNKQLIPLGYFEPGVLCLVAVLISKQLTINRCKIIGIVDNNQKTRKYKVYCLDHGDCFVAEERDLYLCPHLITTKLPYQSIEVKFARFNKLILEDARLTDLVINSIYDMTRDSNNDLIPCKGIADSGDGIYLYVMDKTDKSLYRPLVILINEMHGVNLSLDIPEDSKKDLVVTPLISNEGQDEDEYCHDMRDGIFKCMVKLLLTDIINYELDSKHGRQ